MFHWAACVRLWNLKIGDFRRDICIKSLAKLLKLEIENIYMKYEYTRQILLLGRLLPRSGQGLDLSEFFESTEGSFTTPQVTRPRSPLQWCLILMTALWQKSPKHAVRASSCVLFNRTVVASHQLCGSLRGLRVPSYLSRCQAIFGCFRRFTVVGFLKIMLAWGSWVSST